MEREEGHRLNDTSRYASSGTKTRTQEADRETDTGEPVLLPFRMSAFVLSNLVVTGGMLTPGLSVRLVSD